MDKKAIEIKKLDEDTIEQQLVVYKAAFGVSDGEGSIVDFWKKKHFSNPLGGSLIFGAFVEGELVGINAFMPVLYHFNDLNYKMLQSCESGVLPNFQGYGIWKKLMEYALDYICHSTDYTMVIGFPNYQNSYPGFKKMGWATINDMKNYIMVNNRHAFSSLMKEKSILVRFLMRFVVIQRFIVKMLSLCNRGIEIKETDISDLIWATNEKEVTCNHDELYLKWKDSYKDLKSLLVFKNNSVIASCLYEIGDYDNTEIIKLHKFTTNAVGGVYELGALARILEYMSKKEQSAAFVRVWVAEDGINKIWKRMLFVKSNHMNPFIISDPSNELSRCKWNLSFYDLD